MSYFEKESTMIAKIHYGLMLTATIAAFQICVAPAHAAPLFDVPFTADVAGNPPDTAAANAGGVSTKPTLTVAQSGNSVLVQNGYVDTITGNSLGTGNVMVLSDVGGGSNAVLFQGAASDETSSGVYTVSLDWIEDSGITATSSAFIGLTNQPRSQALSSLFLDLGENAGNLRSGNSVNFGATLGTAARGVAHHLDWVVDLDQANFSIATEVYLDGTLLAVHRREPIGPPHDGASAFGNLQIATSGPAVGTLAFDNIQIQAGRHVVPEPSGMVLLGVAGLLGIGVCVGRRR